MDILANTTGLVKCEDDNMDTDTKGDLDYDKKDTAISQFSLSTKSLSTVRVNFEDFEVEWKKQLLDNAAKAIEYESSIKQSSIDSQLEMNTLS